MSKLNLPSGQHEQERPEDRWTEWFQCNIPKYISSYGGHSFEFGRNYFKFTDKSGKEITVKVSSK